MTAPITQERRKQLQKLMKNVAAASPTVEDDLRAYEVRVRQLEGTLDDLRAPLEQARLTVAALMTETKAAPVLNERLGRALDSIQICQGATGRPRKAAE